MTLPVPIPAPPNPLTDHPHPRGRPPHGLGEPHRGEDPATGLLDGTAHVLAGAPEHSPMLARGPQRGKRGNPGKSGNPKKPRYLAAIEHAIARASH